MTKQIDIIVQFYYDDNIQSVYEDMKQDIIRLQRKEHLTNDDKQIIEYHKQDIADIESNNLTTLGYIIKANVLMPCKHYEEFQTSLWGLWFRYNGLDALIEDYKQDIEYSINDIKEQIKPKLPNEELEFNIIYNEDIDQ